MKMFQTKVVEKLETHIRSITFFLKNQAIYEIIWKNVVQLVRPQLTIWHMYIACWIPNATNRHTGCIILISFPWQQRLHERTSMLHYMYSVHLVLMLILYDA